MHKCTFTCSNTFNEIYLLKCIYLPTFKMRYVYFYWIPSRLFCDCHWVLEQDIFIWYGFRDLSRMCRGHCRNGFICSSGSLVIWPDRDGLAEQQRKLSSEGSTAEIDLWEFVQKKVVGEKKQALFLQAFLGGWKGSIYTCSAVTGTAFHPVILSSCQWDLELAAHSISTWKSDSNSFPFNLRGGGAQMDHMNYNPNAI